MAAIRTQEELWSSLTRRVRLLERRLSRRGAGRSEVAAGAGIDVDGNGSALTPYVVSVEPTVVRSRGTVSSVSAQSGITSTTVVTGLSLVVTTTRASTQLRVYISLITYGTTTADVLNASLRRNGSVVQDFNRGASSSATIAATGNHLSLFCEVTVPAGSHTFDVTLSRAAGSGTINTQPNPATRNRLSVDEVA